MATRSLWCTRDAKNESDSTASTRLNAGQPFTNPAKLLDSELCYRKELRVEVKELDRYQRTIADVIFARRPDSELRDREGRLVVQAVRATVDAPGMEGLELRSRAQSKSVRLRFWDDLGLQ